MIQRNSLLTLPPFPSGVPTAPIARISLSDILSSDPSACSSTLEACSTQGFFYLDLTSTPIGEDLLSQSEELHQLSRKIFDHDLDYKTRHALLKGVSLFGYKSAGTVKATDPTQRPDTTEFFNVSKDHMHGVTESRSYPTEVLENKALLQKFSRNAHALGMVILGTLAEQLGLQPEEFTNKNIFTKPSGDHCRLTRKAAHVTDKETIGLPSHTDFGSITILFNWLGGLQIQSQDPAKGGEWEYVKPMPGCAIINLGDAIVTFTNGALKSAKHRVVPVPGEQANIDRYSVVYFVRPHNETLMEPIGRFRDVDKKMKVAGKFEPEGDGVLTAGEWMVQRGKQMGS